MNVRLTVRNAKGERNFNLDADPSWTVLDLLERIRADKDRSLLYRHSCHHGSCGTCGAMINGAPRLMCLTALADLKTDSVCVEPLAKAALIDGVAVWPGRLFETLPDTDYLRESEGQPGCERLEDCIECGVCAAACPVTKPFVGPAVLAAVAVEKRKHPGRAAAMGAIAEGHDGALACERKFECSRRCPQGVAPGRKITELLAGDK